MRDVVFVGRADEVNWFAGMLCELPARARGLALPSRGHRRGHGRGVAQQAVSPVVLVYGLGGSGKSRLLLEFQRLAQGELAPPPSAPDAGRRPESIRRVSVRTMWLDWATEQQERPDQYRDMSGPTLVTVLDAVVTRLVNDPHLTKRARQRTGRAFTGYRNGVSLLEEYRERFAEVVARSQGAKSPFTEADVATLLKSMASVGFTLAHHPAGAHGQTPAAAASTAQAAIHLSKAALSAVTGKRPGDIPPDDYGLVVDPERELIRRAADGLHALVRSRPLVILLDTGEVLGPSAWDWLRQLMARTGPSVAWVVGARFEAESDADAENQISQFNRKIGRTHLKLMRLTRFDNGTIGDYLSRRTGAGPYSRSQIDAVAKVTRGLPLAVSLVADLIEEGRDIGDVCREAGGDVPGGIVSRLARSYLLRAERREYPPGDPRKDDLQRILVLALGFGDTGNDPEYLSRLWATDDPLGAFRQLAQRHDFVLPVSRRLHDDVQAAIRGDLLDPLRRERARPLNQRALELFKERLAAMRLRLPSLDDQVASEKFRATLLAALWHAFWMDNESGLDLLIEVLPVLAVASPGTAGRAAAMTGRFVGTFDADQRNTIALLTAEPGSARATAPVSAQHALAQLVASTLPNLVHLRPSRSIEDVLAAQRLRLELADGQRLTVSDLLIRHSPKLLTWYLTDAGEPGARVVRYTERGLELRHPGLGSGPPLVGDWDDRTAAIAVLGASLVAGNGDEKDCAQATERLLVAAGQTKSDLLRSRMDLLASLISASTAKSS
ncbi:MAG TPA: hypothetical protein VIZ43_15745 [Trebonia sp.]